MWKLFCQFSVICCLVACQQELEIVPADDLTRFYDSPHIKLFSVKTGWFQDVKCHELEHWAKTHLPQPKDKRYSYRFVQYHDDITLNDNPYLAKEYSALTNEYEICEMFSSDMKCYICVEK